MIPWSLHNWNLGGEMTNREDICTCNLREEHIWDRDTCCIATKTQLKKDEIKEAYLQGFEQAKKQAAEICLDKIGSLSESVKMPNVIMQEILAMKPE